MVGSITKPVLRCERALWRRWIDAVTQTITGLVLAEGKVVGERDEGLRQDSQGQLFLVLPKSW
jgi:hypothetical protein